MTHHLRISVGATPQGTTGLAGPSPVSDQQSINICWSRNVRRANCNKSMFWCVCVYPAEETVRVYLSSSQPPRVYDVAFF